MKTLKTRKRIDPKLYDYFLQWLYPVDYNIEAKEQNTLIKQHYVFIDSINRFQNNLTKDKLREFLQLVPEYKNKYEEIKTTEYDLSFRVMDEKEFSNKCRIYISNKVLKFLDKHNIDINVLMLIHLEQDFGYYKDHIKFHPKRDEYNSYSKWLNALIDITLTETLFLGGVSKVNMTKYSDIADTKIDKLARMSSQERSKEILKRSEMLLHFFSDNLEECNTFKIETITATKSQETLTSYDFFKKIGWVKENDEFIT